MTRARDTASLPTGITVGSANTVGIGATPTTQSLIVQAGNASGTNTGQVSILKYTGTAASPTESLDWPEPILTLRGYGNFTQESMLSFGYSNDSTYQTADGVWAFKLDGTASATSSTSSTNLRLGGPGALVIATAGTERMRIDSSGYVSKVALLAPKEKWTVSATAATGTIQFDCSTQGVLYYTTASTGNFTLNFRGDSTTTLASLMNTGDAITVNFLATNTTAYYQSTAVTVDTSATVTVKWSGGTAPSAGNASAIDIYSYTIVKTGASAFTVLCAGPVKYA